MQPYILDSSCHKPNVQLAQHAIMNSGRKQLEPNAFLSILVKHEKLEQHTILNQLLTHTINVQQEQRAIPNSCEHNCNMH